jgi:hypothetical protein
MLEQSKFLNLKIKVFMSAKELNSKLNISAYDNDFQKKEMVK